MKKSIIAASAASLALAAMPVVGAFATNKDVTDNLELTITSTCSLTRTNEAAGTGTNHGAWDATAFDNEGGYVAEMAANSTSNLGKSTFAIVCNDQAKGHSLSLGVTGLTINDSTNTANGTTIAYDGSNAVGTSTAYWNITVAAVTGTGATQMPQFTNAVDATSGLVTTSNGSATLYSNNKTVLNGASFTADYNVGVPITQPAGTYTGTATYTLTHDA